MNTIKGDLVKLALEGEFSVIVHGCNCFCAMGSGIAKTIRETFPQAYLADQRTKSGDRDKLGSYTKGFDKGVLVINAYTQFHWVTEHQHTITKSKPRGVAVDYNAVREVMVAINKEFKDSDERIGLPLIGAGLAGGDWDTIAAIIKEELTDVDYTVVEYQP